MKLTELSLLNNYDGITNGLDVISVVNGARIIWTYRDDGLEDCCPVTHTPEAAAYPIITLEGDRVGRIETDPHNLDHPNLARMQRAIEAVIGAEVDD